MTNLQKLLVTLTLALCTLFSCTMPATEVAADNGLEITAQAEENETQPENVKTGYLGSEKIYYEVIDGMNIFQGDIILADSQISSTPTRGAGLTTNLWPDSTIYYLISSEFPAALRDTVKAAIAHWDERTDLKFVEGVGIGNFVEFAPHPSYNFSNVGMVRGRQLILLAPAATKGNVLHEIGHTAGLMHEHTRVDRDNSITINWSNIKPYKKYIFKKYNELGYNGFDSCNFDFYSIMLYPSNIASYAYDTTKPVMTKKDGSTFVSHKDRIQTGDVLTINRMYGELSTVYFPANPEFQSTMGFEAGVNIIPGDFDGDGHMDFIRQERAALDDDNKGTFTIYFGKADGGYTEKNYTNIYFNEYLKSDAGCNIIPGDFDGDGKTDFIRQEHSGWSADENFTFSVYFARANRDFEVVIPTGVEYQEYLKADSGCILIPGDYNGDGKTDFIRQERFGWDDDKNFNFSVYFSKGDGNFKYIAPKGDIYQVSLKYDLGAKIVPGDFDGDGKTDFIRQERGNWEGDSIGTFSIYYSKGDGYFNRVSDFAGVNINDMKADKGAILIPGDFNGDGKCDFIRQERNDLDNDTTNNFSIYYATGIRSFNKVTPKSFAYQYMLRADDGANIIPADINGDGKCDFIRQEKGGWATKDNFYTFLFYISK